MKNFLMYLLSVGLAFYLGAKYKQLKTVKTVKVGKFVIELSHQVKCDQITINSGTSVKKVEKSKKDKPTVIKVEPKTDAEKNLTPEKNKKKEPSMFEKDPIEVEAEFTKCYKKAKEAYDSKEIYTYSYSRRMAKCKTKELVYTSCAYLEKEELKECKKDQETIAGVWGKSIRETMWYGTPEEQAEREAQEAQEEAQEKQKKKEELKDTFKEAFEEVKNENTN